MVGEKIKPTIMKKYLHQLLSDIRNAHRHPSQNANFVEHASFLEEMDVIEKWATGSEVQFPLSHHCGLNMEQFPPSNLLKQDEMKILNTAFHNMLDSWHIKAELPDNLPVDRAYQLLVPLLERDIVFFPGGTLHIDFCTGYAPDCELKEYCPCQKYYKNFKKRSA